MIGVFDSGHGGLTVLKALRMRLPHETFLYLGDHANAPYGNRSEDEILCMTMAASETLFHLGCRLVIIACNTSAAIALRPMQQKWLPAFYPENRLLGVLVPMVEAITGVSWMDMTADRPVRPSRTVAVFATQATVRTQAYPYEINKRAPEITVIQQACPLLASAIECGKDDAELSDLVQASVRKLCYKIREVPDFVVLGCTHYPLVAHHFRRELPSQVTILDQPSTVAKSLAHYLERRPQFSTIGGGSYSRFFTTGDPAVVSKLACRFSGEVLPFERVVI